MKVAIFLFVTLFVVAHCEKKEEPLHCFQCNSAEDGACEDEFAEDSPIVLKAFSRPCPRKENVTVPATFCRKTKMWLTGKTIVHRDCGYLRKEGDDCYQTRSDDHVVDICQCEGSNCNAATTSFSTNFVMTLTLFIGAALAAKF